MTTLGGGIDKGVSCHALHPIVFLKGFRADLGTVNTKVTVGVFRLWLPALCENEKLLSAQMERKQLPSGWVHGTERDGSGFLALY